MLRDRAHGGRLLVQELGHIRGQDPIVLGIARGGVPVALEVAKALDAPLDLITVQKVGAVECPEYTVAAVAEDGAVYVRRDALHEVGMTDEDATEIAKGAAIELVRRARAYRGDARPPELAGRTVVVVDDGVATGATACAAARAVRGRGAARVILAAPIVAAAAEPVLRHEFDEVVALDWPRPFVAVGIWYERFESVSDEAVVQYLRLGGEHIPKREADRIWDGEAPRGLTAELPAAPATEVLSIPCEDCVRGFIEADLHVPSGADGIVVFSTGSTRDSPRYRLISWALHDAGLATLRCDLLTPAERQEHPAGVPAHSKVLTSRIATVIRRISVHASTRRMHRGLYGAGAGAEAALAAVASDEDPVEAVVVRAGQLDAIPTRTLASIRAPVLLIVGSRDANVLSANRAALAHLATADLTVVPGVTDLYGEPGALEAVARLAAQWFKHWLGRAAARGPVRPLETTIVPRSPG